MSAGTWILIAGIGGAAFLWYRSQAAQAAALAAAQAAPGPGIIGRAENSISRGTRALVNAAPAAASGAANLVRDTATLDFLSHGTPLNQQTCAQLVAQARDAGLGIPGRNPTEPYYRAARAKGCL